MQIERVNVGGRLVDQGPGVTVVGGPQKGVIAGQPQIIATSRQFGRIAGGRVDISIMNLLGQARIGRIEAENPVVAAVKKEIRGGYGGAGIAVAEGVAGLGLPGQTGVGTAVDPFFLAEQPKCIITGLADQAIAVRIRVESETGYPGECVVGGAVHARFGDAQPDSVQREHLVHLFTAG